MRRKLGIRFGDNDFAKTFRGLLKVMKEEGLHSYPESKTELVELLNKVIPGVYELCQNKGNPDYGFGSIATYLKLGEENIFLDSEVDEFIDNNPYGFNYDFHVLDETPYEPYIYSM